MFRQHYRGCGIWGPRSPSDHHGRQVVRVAHRRQFIEGIRVGGRKIRDYVVRAQQFAVHGNVDRTGMTDLVGANAVLVGSLDTGLDKVSIRLVKSSFRPVARSVFTPDPMTTKHLALAAGTVAGEVAAFMLSLRVPRSAHAACGICILSAASRDAGCGFQLRQDRGETGAQRSSLGIRSRARFWGQDRDQKFELLEH
jgi:hypothetical protein